MADLFSNWLFDKRNHALNLYHSFPAPAFAESPTRTHYLERQVLLEEVKDTRIPITEVIMPRPVASFCKILHIPKQISLVQLKDLKNPDMQQVRERVMHELFSSIDAQESRLMAEHLALLEDGFVLIIPRDFVGSLQLAFILREVRHFHLLMLVGENAKIQATIDVRSESPYATYVQEAMLAPGSSLQVIVRESASAGNLFICKRYRLGDGSSLRSLSASRAAKTLISTTKIIVDGTGVSSKGHALFLSEENGQIEQESQIEHFLPGAQSETTTRGIAGGTSVVLVRGAITIHEQAPKTISNYEGKVLVISDEAKANIIPTLKILTNDVVAKHGAAVGHFNEDDIFYLQSRGLTQNEAKLMLVDGFFAPLLQGLTDADREGLMAFFKR